MVQADCHMAEMINIHCYGPILIIFHLVTRLKDYIPAAVMLN